MTGMHGDHAMVAPTFRGNSDRESGAPATTVAKTAFVLPGFLKTGVGLGLLTSAAVAVVVLFSFGGWQYYWTPQDVRAYTDLHPVLRPSGPVGNLLGVAGVALMLIMHVYTIRKKFPRVRWLGRMNLWLEFHIFCGVLGPALITLHTSFKFNGLISVAYWSMVIVVLSGFVGRYLYVRIPRSIRGQELTGDELGARAASIKASLDSSVLPQSVRDQIERFDRETAMVHDEQTTWRGLFLGEIGLRLRLVRFSRTIRRQCRDNALVHEAVSLIFQRALLMRRIAYLVKTKKVFDLWRVYHKPLAVLMAVIVVLHIATIWYLGYAFSIGT